MKAINKFTIATAAVLAVALSCTSSKVYDPAQDDKNKKEPVENTEPEYNGYERDVEISTPPIMPV